jgi:DNA invertase Pin-like site-specific DNA recombinase
MQAILYSRWSSLEQSGTTSAPRQLELCEAFARSKGWQIGEPLVDSGRSAWTGENLTVGNLGQFAERVQRDGGTGLVLIVEKLDRLSRQKPRVMARWIETMVLTGLTIATADGRHVLTEAALDNPMTYMSLIFEAFRGYEESETKSVRVANAWDQKRVLGAPMTKRCPAWLTIADKATNFKSSTNATATYEPIPERVAIVRRIFDMTEQGMGKATIAAAFNREGVPVFGRGDGWHASYVQKILSNRSVIGEYQPHTKPKGGVRKPVGEPIPGYFPAIIDLDQFERVNNSKSRAVAAVQGGREKLVNILSGLTGCTACGRSMTSINCGVERLADGSTISRRYLMCSSAHRSHGCTNRVRFSYKMVETAVLDELLHLAMDDQHFAAPSAGGQVEKALADAKRALVAADKRRQVALEEREDDPEDEMAKALYRKRRDEFKAATVEVEHLEGEVAKLRGAVSPQEHLKRVSEVRAMMHDDDPDTRYKARQRVKLALNDLVEAITFNGRKKRWVLAIRDHARMITFNMDGTKGLDVDWTETKPEWVDTSDPVLAGYQRRKVGDGKRRCQSYMLASGNE